MNIYHDKIHSALYCWKMVLQEIFYGPLNLEMAHWKVDLLCHCPIDHFGLPNPWTHFEVNTWNLELRQMTLRHDITIFDLDPVVPSLGQIFKKAKTKNSTFVKVKTWNFEHR